MRGAESGALTRTTHMITNEMGETWRPRNRTESVGIASYRIRKTEPFSVALNTMSTSSESVGGPDVAVNVGTGRGRVIQPGAEGSPFAPRGPP